MFDRVCRYIVIFRIMERRRKIVGESVTVCTVLDTTVCNELDAAALRLRITRSGLMALLVEAFVASPDCVKCMLDAKSQVGERLIRYIMSTFACAKPE